MINLLILSILSIMTFSPIVLVQSSVTINASITEATPQQEARVSITLSELPTGLDSFNILFSVVPCSSGDIRSISMPEYGATTINRLTPCSLSVNITDVSNLLTVTLSPKELFAVYVYPPESAFINIALTIISMIDDVQDSVITTTIDGSINVVRDFDNDAELSKWSAHTRSFKIGARTRRQVSSLGIQNYQDKLGVWQKIDLSAQEPISGLGFMYQKLPYKLRINEEWSRIIFPDRNDFGSWVNFDMPEAVETPIRTGNGRFDWDMGNYIYQLSVQSSAVKFDILLENDLAPLSFLIPMQLQNLELINGVFFKSGRQVATLGNFNAFDSGDEDNQIVRPLDVIIDSSSITLSLDDTGMIYPITIDPTFNIGASTDDGSERADTGDTNTGATTTQFGNGGPPRHNGLRFTGITGLSGATITTARLTFRALANDSGNFDADWFTEDTDACIAFSNTDFDITDRTLSTAFVSGDGTDFGNWTLDADETFDVVSITQERADEGDPSTLCYIHFNNEGDTGERVAESWDHANSNEPEIEIISTSGARRRIILITKNYSINK